MAVTAQQVALISPSSEKFFSSWKLSFENTNNIEKCETLLLGLEEEKERGIKFRREKGDVELTVK